MGLTVVLRVWEGNKGFVPKVFRQDEVTVNAFWVRLIDVVSFWTLTPKSVKYKKGIEHFLTSSKVWMSFKRFYHVVRQFMGIEFKCYNRKTVQKLYKGIKSIHTYIRMYTHIYIHT